MIPFWAVLALGAAFSMSAIPLVQEKFKADGFALALWNKLVTTIILTPFILSVGFPHDWQFYFYLLITAVLYSVSDVFYFRNVPIIGSGLMTRLIPSSVVITFFLWFAVDPSSITTYTTPWFKGIAVLGIFTLFLYSAMHIKKCNVSWQAVRKIWPIILAACTGAVFSKLALNHADNLNQGPFAYIFLQSVMMAGLLFGYHTIKKPVPKSIMLSRNTITTAIVMGIVSSLPIFLKMKAIQLTDNPGLVSMIAITDSLWVLLIYRLTGRRENGNIWAGLGIVASAFLIVLVKSL
jgi:uncharacterized membrane protein